MCALRSLHSKVRHCSEHHIVRKLHDRSTVATGDLTIYESREGNIAFSRYWAAISDSRNCDPAVSEQRIGNLNFRTVGGSYPVDSQEDTPANSCLRSKSI